MSLYPTISETPYITIGQGNSFKTLTSNFDDLGRPQVKRKWLFSRRSLTLDYTNILNSEFNILEKFYMARHGGYSAFTLIMPTTEYVAYENEYVSTGDGSTLIYNLPMKTASLVSIYVDNNDQNIAADATAAGDCYIIEDGGQDGVDSLIFDVAPSLGTRITCDFTGRLAMRCRFGDQLSHQRSRSGTVSVSNLSVSLLGLLMDE